MLLCLHHTIQEVTDESLSRSCCCQAVTKYTVQASRAPDAEQPPAGPQQQGAAAPAAASQPPMVLEINIRDAFVAPAGRLLLSADYSQIELRLLAHFSKDAGLQQLLRQAGPAGDVFTAMAARCMKDLATGAWWLGSAAQLSKCMGLLSQA